MYYTNVGQKVLGQIFLNINKPTIVLNTNKKKYIYKKCTVIESKMNINIPYLIIYCTYVCKVGIRIVFLFANFFKPFLYSNHCQLNKYFNFRYYLGIRSREYGK